MFLFYIQYINHNKYPCIDTGDSYHYSTYICAKYFRILIKMSDENLFCLRVIDALTL